MMIRSLELVLSVKGKITRLSVSPSGPTGFCFTAPTKRGKDQKRKGVRDFTDGRNEVEEWEKTRIMAKGFVKQEKPSFIHRKAIKGYSSPFQPCLFLLL